MIDAFLAPPSKTTFKRKTIRAATTHREHMYLFWNSKRYSRCFRRTTEDTMQYKRLWSASQLLFWLHITAYDNPFLGAFAKL